MASLEAIRKITIQTTAEGADQTAADIKKISTAQGDLALASDKSSKASAAYERALLSQRQELVLYQKSSQEMVAANNNVSNSFNAANDNAESFGKGIASHAADFLNNVNHLKLMALAAYAMSPAFRSFTNTEVSAGLRLIGINMGLVSAAAQGIAAVAAPALSFFARIAIPIGLAVAAWTGLNYVINLGSDILKKYADAERSLFASDVNDNLTKLTKFQTDTISLQQVAIATDLAARMKEAKQTISDFFSVQFDLTEPALRLQTAWVNIVETIAKGVDLLNNFAGVAQSVGNSSIWDKLNWGWHLPGAMTPSQVIQPAQTQDNSAALAIAKQNLAGGMGSTGTFANRFSQDINALAKKPDETKTANDARDAWDRATDAIDKHAAKLSADTIAVGQSSAEQEQLRAEFSLLEAAKISDRDVTDKQIAAYTELRGHMTAQQALQAAGIKWSEDEKAAFDRTTASIKLRTDELERAKINETISRGQQTAFLTPEDVQIANQLKTIYPNVATAMNSVEAAGLRMNQALSTTSQQISGGLTTALTDVAMGTKTAAQSFKDFSLIAIRAIEQMIIQLTIVGPLMRGLQGGLTSMFPGLFPAAASGPLMSVSGGAGQGFMVPTASGGGMVETLSGRAWVHSAYFENAPRFDTGGMITDDGVPIIAHPGERVLNRAQTAAYNSGSGGTTIHMGDVHIDASGADPAVVARLQSALAQDRAQRYSDVVKIVQDASNRGMRLHQ
jgi:hypothetical protein